MDEPKNDTQASNSLPEEHEINLLDLAIVLAKRKKTILGVPLFAAVLVAGLTLLMPNIYTARAVILPPQQGQSSTVAMLSAITGLSGGLGSSPGLKNPNDLYVGMMNSRTVADGIIARFNLREVYEEKTLAGTYKRLGRVVDISSGKDNLIVVQVEDKDPKRAADMANAYVDELYKLTTTLAVTEASQRRLFFEKQLKKSKDDLALAEISLKNTQEQTGLIQLEKQGEAMIAAIGELRAQIAAKEIELSAMQTFATQENPQYVRTQQTLAGMRAQLVKLEEKGGGNGDVFVPTGKVPELGLEYIRKLRDVKYYETIFELLAKQYELAKVDEAKDTSIIQVVDKALPPDRKSKPKRALMVILVWIVSTFIAVMYSFVLEAWERAKSEPQLRERLRVLRDHIVWKRA